MAQGRWRVATRAFNRDKRSCHEAGSGITIRELEPVYRARSLREAVYLHRG